MAVDSECVKLLFFSKQAFNHSEGALDFSQTFKTREI